MTEPFETYCIKCEKDTEHDVYINKQKYFHSYCNSCLTDFVSRKEVFDSNGEGLNYCGNCDTITVHFYYLCKEMRRRSFCCSCGYDGIVSQHPLSKGD